MPTRSSKICDRVSLISLSLSVLLSIIIFLPGGFIPSDTLKGYLVVISILVAFIAWLVGRLIEGSFQIPRSKVIGASGIFIVGLFLSAFFSHTPYLAFFGENFEKGTLVVLGTLLIGMFLASTLFTTKKRAWIFLHSFFLLYILVALFQLLHVFFPSATSLNIFFNRVGTPLGLWSDFAFFSGAALIGFTLILQFTKPVKILKIFSIAGFILSLFFVTLCNILGVWILVGFLSIVILVYNLIINRFANKRQFPFFAFALALIALLFVLANNLIGGVLATALNTDFLDVHPSLSATMHVSAQILHNNPVFGSGLNSFSNQWLLHRPLTVNNSSLWDTPFSSGSSFLATIGILGGGVGIIAVILFALAFMYESISNIFRSSHEVYKISEDNFLTLCFFMITFFLFLSILLFDPGISIITTTFIFIGVFLGLLYSEKIIEGRSIEFLKDQRSSFFSILLIVALLMASAGTVYVATEHFAGIVFFEKALVSSNAGDTTKSNMRLSQAINLTDLPVYERARVLIAQQTIKQTLSMPSDSISTDQAKNVLQNAISLANTAGRQAISLDSSDPSNYLVLGDFLRMISPLKIDGIEAAAVGAYSHVITLAPHYPKAYLDLAEVYFDYGDNKNARIYVQKAIDEKANYTDAYFLMSQIEASDGNTDTAISKLQNATVFDPNNPDIYFELGLLYYNSGNYTDAVSSLHLAITLDNQYLNAWYYLALADQKLGNNNEANSILNILNERFPNNSNILNALNPVSTNTSTTSTSTTKTTKQEKAKNLPLPTNSSTNNQ